MPEMVEFFKTTNASTRAAYTVVYSCASDNRQLKIHDERDDDDVY